MTQDPELLYLLVKEKLQQLHHEANLERLLKEHHPPRDPPLSRLLAWLKRRDHKREVKPM